MISEHQRGNLSWVITNYEVITNSCGINYIDNCDDDNCFFDNYSGFGLNNLSADICFVDFVGVDNGLFGI